MLTEENKDSIKLYAIIAALMTTLLIASGILICAVNPLLAAEVLVGFSQIIFVIWFAVSISIIHMSLKK